MKGQHELFVSSSELDNQQCNDFPRIHFTSAVVFDPCGFPQNFLGAPQSGDVQAGAVTCIQLRRKPQKFVEVNADDMKACFHSLGFNEKMFMIHDVL